MKKFKPRPLDYGRRCLTCRENYCFGSITGHKNSNGFKHWYDDKDEKARNGVGACFICKNCEKFDDKTLESLIEELRDDQKGVDGFK